METGDLFFYLRIVYSASMLAIVISVVYWAVRTNQFGKQDEASRLPLDIEDEDPEEESE